MVTWIRQFLAEMKALSGKTPVIYAAPGFWATCTRNYTGFGSYPLWLVEYGVASPSAMPGWSNPTFWQYTASGAVSGISGPVDLDYLGPILQSSVVGTAVRPVQLQTLNALNLQGGGNGHAVTYSSASLPPGLSVRSPGQITGTPAAVGSYRVTVAVAGGQPSAISFTWDTHEVLSAPASEATTAGVPVSLRVRAVGYTPLAFMARGLPSGMTISSTGLITGWPDVPGHYKVTVSTVDRLHARASTTIAWTVKAAADRGPAGAIRQHGGSGKCLDDPSAATAPGTAIDLASCTGQSSQEWTAVQDGTIRVLGRCLTARGAHLFLYGCDNSVTQEWLAGTGGSLVSARYGSCLTGPAGAVANGTQPALAACPGGVSSAVQHWNRRAAPVVSGIAARCLGDSGAVAELVTCANVTAQHWSLASSGQVVVQANGSCLTESGTAAGSALVVATCASAASQHWSVVSAGAVPAQIKAVASGLCVTVPPGASASGTRLVLGPCSTALNSTWRIG
jgi:hypothetical protein